jgi:hypothetical protein
VPFISLLLGALATFNPFIGLLVMMIYSHNFFRSLTEKPVNRALLFLVFPVVMAIFSFKNPTTLIFPIDAIFGAGLVVILYLYALIKQGNPIIALIFAALLITVYGVARYYLFKSYLLNSLDQSFAQMEKIMPQAMQNENLTQMKPMLQILLPASWTTSQILSLSAGHLIFLHLGGSHSELRNFKLPTFYNLFIIAILPLYFFPQLHTVFINVLLALCVLPMVEGIGVIINLLSKRKPHILINILVTILVLLNLPLMALIGFADIWINFRKLNMKGNLL